MNNGKPTGKRGELDFPRWKWTEKNREDLNCVLEKAHGVVVGLEELAGKTLSRLNLIGILNDVIFIKTKLEDITKSGKTEILEIDLCDFVLNGAEFDAGSVSEVRAVYEAYLRYFSSFEGDVASFSRGTFTRRITRMFRNQIAVKNVRIGDRVACCFIGLRLKGAENE
jgi:hypothetical protein